jgi:hypothetical protein
MDGQLPSSVTAVFGPDSTTVPFVVRISGAGILRNPFVCGGVVLKPPTELQGELVLLDGPLAMGSIDGKPFVRTEGKLILRPPSEKRDVRAIRNVFSRSSLLQNAQRIFRSARMHNSASSSRLDSLANKLAEKKHPSLTSEASYSNSGLSS